MNIPRFRRSAFGTQVFSVAGPTIWNSLPDSLRDPAVKSERFRQDSKTHLFTGHYTGWPKEVSHYKIIKKIVLNRIIACQ